MPTTTASCGTMISEAERALRRGRLDDAVAHYARALAIDPEQPDAWFNRAWAERANRRFADALESYRRAIAAGLAHPHEAHLNRAAILSDHLFRPDDATAELRLALDRDPDFIPAWLSLGAVHEDCGRFDEAADAYRAAVACDGANGRAHARLAHGQVAAGRATEAIAALRKVLPTVRSIEDRADILFALGAALDACGAYDDAFHAIEAANWLTRPARRMLYDPAAMDALVDRLIRAFPEPGARALAPPGIAPLFICGLFRSGSTLVEQLLGRHSAVTAGGELETIPAMARRLQSYPEAVGNLSLAEQATLRDAYLNERAAVGTGLVTDKRCDNFLHIGLIKTLFPEAQIVHTVRHPLDGLLSAWFLHFGEGVNWSHDLREAAHYYLQYRRLMAHWQTLWPDDIHDWDYDRAVADPRTTMADLLAWLDLPWNDACMGTTPAAGAIRTASGWAVRQPINTRSSGRWRNYAAHLGEVRRILAEGGIAT